VTFAAQTPRLTEDQEATTSPESTNPFSELIRDWLDEGDRLDATASTARAVPSRPDGPLRRIVRRLQPALATFDRYRVVVLAAIGLVPFALFTLTHHAPPAPIAVAAVVAAPPSVSPLPLAPPPTPAAPAPAPPTSVPPLKAAMLTRARFEAAVAPPPVLPAGPLAPARRASGPKTRHRSSSHRRRAAAAHAPTR